jgi:hypothetical protein
MRTPALSPVVLVVLALTAWACGGGGKDADATADVTVDGLTDAPTDGLLADTDGQEPADAKEAREPDAQAVRALLDAGIVALGLYACDLARDDFEAALAEDPGNREALYGLVLTDIQKAWQLIDMLVAELAPPAEVSQESPPVDLPAPQRNLLPGLQRTQILSDFVEVVLVGLTDLGERQLERIDRILADEADVTLVVPALPLHLATLDFLTFHGRWTRTDLHLISAGQKLLTSLFTYLRAHSLQGNLLNALSLNTAVGTNLGGDVLGVLPAVLAGDARFLTFRDDDTDGNGVPDGRADYSRAFRLFAEAGDDALRWRLLLEAETGDTSDRVFAAGPSDLVSSTVARVKGAKGDQAVVLWEGNKLSVAAFFDVLARSAGGDEPRRLSLSGHVVPVLAVLVDVIRQGAGLSRLSGLFGLTGALADVLTNLDDKEVTSPEEVPKLLANVIGTLLIPDDLLELDLATAALRAVPLRAVLPAVTAEEPWTWRRRFDCPIFGAASASADGGYAVVLQDPDGERDVHAGPGNDTAPVCFRSLTADGAPRDHECTTLAESADVAGRFTVTLTPTFVADAASVSPDDGTLELAPGDLQRVEAVYLDTACEPPHEVVVAWTAGLTDRTIEAFAACWDGLACDRPHRFPGATLLADPTAGGAETLAYPDLPADGWASTGAYQAWGSPSFNGLLWVDLDKLRKADPTLDASKTPVGGGLKPLDPVSANIFFTLLPKLLQL